MLSSDVTDMKPIFIKYSKNQLLDIYNSDLSHCTPHCFLPQNYIGDIPLRSDKYDSLKPNYKKKSFELDYESHAYPLTSSRKINGRHTRADESAMYDRFSRGTGIGDRGRKYIIQNNLAAQTKYYQSSSSQNKFANTNKIANRVPYDKETPFDEVPYGRKQFSHADSHFLDGPTQDDLTTTRDYDKDNHSKSNSNPFLRQHNSGSPPLDTLEHANAYDRNNNKFYDETKSYEPKGMSMFDRRRYGPHISQNASSYQRNNLDYKKRNTTTTHYNSNYHFNNAQHNNSKYGISPATVEEPEWFTEGPTSHMDKIELGGFFNQQKDHPSNETISNNNGNENILCETKNELLVSSEHYGSGDINGNHTTAKNVDSTNIMFDYQAWKKSISNTINANTNRNIGNLSDYSKLDNISEEQTVCDDMTTNKERIIYENEGTDAFGTHNINKKAEPAITPNTSPHINQYENDVEDIPLPNISDSTQIMHEDENTLFQSRFKAFFDEKSIRNYTNVNAPNKSQDQLTLQGESLHISENATNEKQMTPFQKLVFAIQTHQKQRGEKNVVTSPEPTSAFQKSMNLSHLSQIPLPSGDPTIQNNYPDNFESEIVDENLTEADILRDLNVSPNQKNVENIDYDTDTFNDNTNANMTDNSQLLLSMLQKLNITSTHAFPCSATNKPDEDTFSGTLDSNDHGNNINNPNPNNTNRMAMKNVINHFYSTANTFQQNISSTQSHNNNLPFGKISAPISNNTTTIITNHTAMANNNIIPPPLPPQFVMGYPPPPFGLVPPPPPIPPFFPPPSLLSRSAVLPPPPHLPLMMPPPPPPEFMMATLSGGGGFPPLQTQQAMTDQQQQTRQTTMDGNQINQSMKENTSNKNMFINPTTNNMRNILPEHLGNKSLRSVTNLTPTAVFRHLMSNSPKNVDLQPDYTTREAVSNNFKDSSNNMDGNTIMQYLSLLREQKNIINNFTTQEQDNSKAFESTTHNSKGMDSLIDKINLNDTKNIKQSDFDENNNFMNTGFSLTLLQQQYVSLVNLLKMRDKLTPAQIALLQNYFSQFQSAINKAGLQHLFALEPNTSIQQSTDNFSNSKNNEINESLELRNDEID